jgi:hypothetical protein
VPLGFPTQDAPNGGLWHAKSGSADPSNHNDADLQGTGGTRGARSVSAPQGQRNLRRSDRLPQPGFEAGRITTGDAFAFSMLLKI